MWMKTPAVVEERLPAATALIRIGPEAEKALIRALWGTISSLDRPKAIFAVARIGGPEARSFLYQVITENTFENTLANRGLNGVY
jgi:HEAT repeat protein